MAVTWGGGTVGWSGGGSGGTSVTLPLPLADGGTEADLSAVAKGDLITGTAAGAVGLKTVGADGTILTADAASAGGVTWAAAPAPGAAGANTQVMFNDGGAVLGGDAGLTYDKTTNALSVFGPILAQPLADAQSVVMRRFGAAQTNKILEVQTELNAEIASIAADGSADFTSLTLDTPLAPAEGGTGADTSAIALGGLLTGTGAGTIGVKAVGADGTFLRANSGAAGGVEWAAGGGGITNSAGANVIPKSDGTNLVASTITDDGTTVSMPGTGGVIVGSAASGKIYPTANGISVGTSANARVFLGGTNAAFGVHVASNGGIGFGSAASSSSVPLSYAPDIAIARAAAAVLQVTNGSTGIGSVLNARLVEANMAGSGTPNALAATESNTVLTNEGSTAANYHTLPTAAAGLTFTFVVQDGDGLRCVANTGDTIRVIDKVTAAAGYIESTTIGSVVTLVAINATEWVAISIHGTWTDGTFTYDDTGLTTP